MSTKHLFTISLLLPLVAISATAYAGSTITDKNYWPSEARKSAHGTVGSPGDIFAYEPTVTFAARDRPERAWIRLAISRRPESPVTSAAAQWSSPLP